MPTVLATVGGVPGSLIIVLVGALTTWSGYVVGKSRSSCLSNTPDPDLPFLRTPRHLQEEPSRGLLDGRRRFRPRRSHRSRVLWCHLRSALRRPRRFGSGRGLYRSQCCLATRDVYCRLGCYRAFTSYPLSPLDTDFNQPRPPGCHHYLLPREHPDPQQGFCYRLGGLGFCHLGHHGHRHRSFGAGPARCRSCNWCRAYFLPALASPSEQARNSIPTFPRSFFVSQWDKKVMAFNGEATFLGAMGAVSTVVFSYCGTPA